MFGIDSNLISLILIFFSTVQQLQQAIAVQQQPQNEKPLPSNENGVELSGRRISRKRKSVHEPEREPESVPKPKPKQTRRHSMHSKAILKRQGRNRILLNKIASSSFLLLLLLLSRIRVDLLLLLFSFFSSPLFKCVF